MVMRSESVGVLILEHFAQVIRHAVRAVLGRQSVEKSDVGEGGEGHYENPAPQFRKRRERLSGIDETPRNRRRSR